MRKYLLYTLIAGFAVTFNPLSALARDWHGHGHGHAHGGYYGHGYYRGGVVVAAPGYYDPYYAPAPYYPAPAYYAPPPAYYAPAPFSLGFSFR